ncbi:MAG: DDE transposase, partial [Sedimentisphaeraceae bacterium JB056]
MAIIQNKNIFSWKNFDNIGDLERFKLLLSYIPDEKLMRTLEKHRGNGRNDYPIRAIWNSLLAAV